MNNIIMVILLLIFVTLVFIKEGESVQCHICSGPDNCLDGLCKDEVCVKIITKPKRGGKMGVDKKCATKATYGEMKCEKDDSRSSMDYEVCACNDKDFCNSSSCYKLSFVCFFVAAYTKFLN